MARPALSTAQIEARREEILDVAEALFDEQGLEAVSFRRIAARAGCSPNAPYRVFATKQHVLLGLRIRGYRAVEANLEAAVAGQSRPLDQLRALAAAYIQFALDEPARYGLLFTPGDADEAEPELDAAKRAALGVCQRVIAQAADAGEFRLETDALTAAHLFWAAAHGAVSLQLAGQLVMGRSLDRLVASLIATLVRGLSRPEADA